MLEDFKKGLALYKTSHEKFNHLRELLQLVILRILDEKGYFKKIAFVGGTALRILYDLRRFSEDLDFSALDTHGFSFSIMVESIIKELSLENLHTEITLKDQKTVGTALLKFPELLHTLKLSTHKDQKLFIKLEVDKNPPSGYKTELTVINKEFLIGIQHYDLPSLFAGKLHAVLYRKYTKGRDYYDLMWYLTRHVEPNYTLLEHAIFQTDHKKISLNKEALHRMLTQRIEHTDFKKVSADISPFLEDPKELRFFNQAHFLKLITH